MLLKPHTGRISPTAVVPDLARTEILKPRAAHEPQPAFVVDDRQPFIDEGDRDEQESNDKQGKFSKNCSDLSASLCCTLLR